MKSHHTLFTLQPQSTTPRPLQLLAECSLAIASQSQLSFIPAQFQNILNPLHRRRYHHRPFPPPPPPPPPPSSSRVGEPRGKRKASEIMNTHDQPDDDLQLQGLQEQQQKSSSALGNLSPAPPPSPSAPSVTKDAGLNTLICAVRSSPCTVQDTSQASHPKDSRPIPTLPLTFPVLKPSSICSSAVSCCDVDDCTSKCASECDDEDCTEPCEDCLDTPCDLDTNCQIVPILCSEKSCLGPKAPCPEDETCVQEIICQSDGCEVTNCYHTLGYSGYWLSEHAQSFVEPPPSWVAPQAFHGSVEPSFLDLSYGNSTQHHQQQLNEQLQLEYPQEQLYTFPNQQHLNNHIHVIATSEPSQSSRSSSAFLETYDSFSANSPFDHDYIAITKRRRVSSTTPLTSPSFEPYTTTPSKSSTPFTEPLPQWTNYNSSDSVQPSWNGNHLMDDNSLLGNNNCLNENNLFAAPDANLLELSDCHWDDCNAHLATDEDLQLHLSTHLDPSLEQCLWDACGLEIHGIDELKSHLQHEHLVPAETESASIATATECRWEDGSGGIVCGKVFSNTEELQRHVKEVHIAVLKKKTGYHCRWKDCGRRDRGFSQKGKVERHMQTHTGFKSCKCHVCDKEFSASQALQQHIRTHTGEKPYKCDICQKEFAQGSALTMHKRVHTGDRPLKCEFPGCGKRFSESSNLSKHRKTHLSVGQHRCGYAGCDKTFHRPDQMKRHQKVHGTTVSTSNNLFPEQPYAPVDDFT